MPPPTPYQDPPESAPCRIPRSSARNSYLHCPIPGSCDACPSVAQLETEIMLAQNHLSELKQRLVTLQREINKRHDPLSRLPTELVSEIFEIYCADSDTSFTLRNKAPLVIGEVCKRWREITLGTPQLWSTVRIRADNVNPYDLDVAGEWLSRSGPLPLTLDIDFDDQWFEEPPQDNPLSPLIQLLRSHSIRWRDMILGTFEADIIVPALFVNLEKMPSNFGTLDLRSTGHSNDFECSSDTLLCPQTLRIDNGSRTNGLPLGWERLTCLCSHDALTLKEVLDIIENAPVLAECIVTLDEDKSVFIFDGSPIMSHSIASLETDGGSSESENLLNFLTLPSLETLTYEYNCSSPEDTDPKILHDFLYRSSPTLKNFHLTIIPHEPNYVDIWRTKDVSLTLTSLDFNASIVSVGLEGQTKITKDFMAMLSTLLDDGSFPKLRRLEFHPPITPDFWSDLCDLIQKRVQIQSSEYYSDTDASRPIACRRKPLRSVVVNLGTSKTLPVSMDAMVHSRLIEMARSGVEIHVRKTEFHAKYPFHKLNVNLNTLS